MYGPWSTVHYEKDENFLDMRGGLFLGMNFPIKWQTGGGTTLWAVFSCYDVTTWALADGIMTAST